MILDHNSCLFLSQALWPLQTYRAYLSIDHCRPQPQMCPLVCIMIFHPNRLPSVLFQSNYLILKKILRSYWVHSYTSVSKQVLGRKPSYLYLSFAVQLISCLSKNFIAYAASVFGSRRGILSQSSENREGVSRLCFPRSHATRHTHTFWKRRRLSADTSLSFSGSDSTSSCFLLEKNSCIDV